MLLTFTSSEHLKLEIKTLKKALESDAANYSVKETHKKVKENVNTCFVDKKKNEQWNQQFPN